MRDEQLKMTKEQKGELNSLKNRLQGDRLYIYNELDVVVVDDYSTKRRIKIYPDGDRCSGELPKFKLSLYEIGVLIMVPVYLILFFSLGEEFMIPIFILGVINLFLAYGVIF